ncbi:hypothetical protein M438DRAFT_346717 [Aureobasidium pullulans EXF-150]|uniref:Uncharacterized protein n=1 Tax=Aureobasidium pullulans EXF-150 TaxID=1043002 RepID=A0A074XC33_AURPU|nr:uncharacterized protein M438DRAFT_346717 [Aureobasidium pullulans EXF-150]KEQ83065.1 hypothetical protein M438DRAFT_346717 [Aureobasidium pullulans EXF-150]
MSGAHNSRADHADRQTTLPRLRERLYLLSRGPSVLFEIIGDRKSSSRRRKLVDSATDTPLFELRRRYFNFKEQWCLEFPEDVSDQSHSPQFSLAMKWKGWSNFDITMDNMASSNVERVVLEVRARTVRHTTYDISLNGQKIVEARKIPGEEAPGVTARIRNNPAWELDVGAGVDTSLASIIAVMLTDLNPANIWTRTSLNHTREYLFSLQYVSSVT